MDKFIFWVSVLWSCAVAAMVANPSGWVQLLLLPLTALFLAASVAALIRTFTQWSRRRLAALIPLLTCLFSVPVAGLVGAQGREAIFLWSLPSFENVVARIQSGDIPVTRDLNRLALSEGEARLAYAVSAQRDTAGVLTVEFLTGGGFPVKHSGYLYCSSGLVEPGSTTASRWPRHRAVRPNWFRISD